MKKYEYKIVDLNKHLSKEDVTNEEQGLEAIERTLNELGADGWRWIENQPPAVLMMREVDG